LVGLGSVGGGHRRAKVGQGTTAPKRTGRGRWLRGSGTGPALTWPRQTLEDVLGGSPGRLRKSLTFGAREA
jgi:hypothetical protein